MQDTAGQRASINGLVERFDAYDPNLVGPYWEVAAELRERCPVARSDAHGGFWVVSRFAEVTQGFADDARLSTVPTTQIPPNPAAVKMLPLQADGELHVELRRLLNPWFRASAVGAFADEIRRTVTALIDAVIEERTCDFIGQFARPLAGDVIFRMLLGLSKEELDEAYQWTMAIVHGPASKDASVTYERFAALVDKLLERRRGESRREDVIDAILYGEIDGRPLSSDEQRRTTMHLIVAGLDTTVHALGNFMVRFARDPGLLARLADQPQLIPAAIEELLRIDPPAGGLVRTAVADVVIGEREISAGDRVLLLVAGANRDPRAFAEPEQIALDRGSIRHLAWGHGAHLCLGMHLARLELRVALEELASRLSHVSLVDADLEYDRGCSRGPSRLMIAFTPGG